MFLCQLVPLNKQSAFRVNCRCLLNQALRAGLRIYQFICLTGVLRRTLLEAGISVKENYLRNDIKFDISTVSSEAVLLIQ